MSLKKNNKPTGTGKRREKQKAETYSLILESARFMFETQGFKKSTIRAVASHAEIGLGTIYKHFKNKTSLLAAAFYDDLVRLFNEAVETIPEDVSIKEQLIHLAGFNYRFYSSRPKLSQEYFSQIIFVEGEWFQKIELFENNYAEKVVQMVCSAQKQGEISAEKDCYYVAMSFIADYFLVLRDLFYRKKINDSKQLLSFLKKLIDQTIP